jgi:hypothetical protein
MKREDINIYILSSLLLWRNLGSGLAFHRYCFFGFGPRLILIIWFSNPLHLLLTLAKEFFLFIEELLSTQEVNAKPVV